MRSRAASNWPERARATPIVLLACATAAVAVRRRRGIRRAVIRERASAGLQRALGPADRLLVVAAPKGRQAELLIQVRRFDVRRSAFQRRQRALIAAPGLVRSPPCQCKVPIFRIARASAMRSPARP